MRLGDSRARDGGVVPVVVDCTVVAKSPLSVVHEHLGCALRPEGACQCLALVVEVVEEVARFSCVGDHVLERICGRMAASLEQTATTCTPRSA